MSMRGLKETIKNGLSSYFCGAYIEFIYLDFLILINLLHAVFDLEGSYILWIVVGAVIILVLGLVLKLLIRKRTRKVFLFNLLRGILTQRAYLPVFIFNLLIYIFLTMVHLTILSDYPYYDSEFSIKLFYLFVVIRILFTIEDQLIQSKILISAIQNTESYEQIDTSSPLATDKTYSALMNLTRIKDHMYHVAQASVESQKMKTELITNISHDLKTPLTSIINYADILSKKEVMDDEARGYIRVLGRNSQRLKSLIVDLIDASKSESGNIHLEPVFFDFNEMVNQIYADFESNYASKELNFIYEADHEDIAIYSDPDILSRVIQNVFSNAYKYSLPGTRVYGKTFTTEDRIYFNIKNISKEPLNVSSKELQSQFIRGERSRTTEGSGLGLYISKNLTEILKGEFRIVIDGDYFQVFIELPLEIE